MPDTLTKKGDRVIGDILIATGRTISKVDLVNATSTHKGMQCKIKGSAWCVIDRPIKSVRERKG